MATTNKRVSVAMPVGSMYSAGDAGSIPDGTVRSLSNMLPQPNRVQVRPPFVYDSLMGVSGLFNYDDPTNQISRLGATGAVLNLKGTSGETWAAFAGISGTRITDFANYRGNVYLMLDSAGATPTDNSLFNGTTATSNNSFDTAICSRTITAFNDRLFLGYPRVIINNLMAAVNTGDPYDWSTARFTRTSTTVTILNSQTTRVTPTATSGAYVEWTHSATSLASQFLLAGGTAAPIPLVYTQHVRNTSTTAAVPITLEIHLATAWQLAHVYALGELVSDGTYLQRVTTAGTSQNPGPPAWNATVGGTTADNTVVWTNEGLDTLATTEATIPPLTDTAFGINVATGMVPVAANHNGVAGPNIRTRFKFGNTTTPTLPSLVPVDVAFRDGLTNGLTTKATKGGQLTIGSFIFPFFNVESATSSTQDLQQIVWTEIGQPSMIRAANTYNPWEVPGYITAATCVEGRYLAFKRTGFFVFQGSSDPDNPIVREDIIRGCGCIGSRSIDTFEGRAYFIGENDIYSYRPGDIEPTPLCGDGMREEIMSKGTNWVESQSYKMPFLTIDRSKFLLWAYTQKATLYCYDLRSKIWSKHTTPNSAEVASMLYNSNTGKVYVSFAYGTYGLARLDFTASAANDTIDNTANTYSVSADIVFKPIELYQPPRFDATLEDIRFFHAATASQSSQTCTASYSTDQGTTYTRTDAVTLSPLSSSGEFIPVRLNALQTAPSVTVKLNHTGKAGATSWAISPRVYANINVRRGEYIQGNQTGGSANLVNP